MKLFELNISSVWWFSADDEWEATEMLRTELSNREVSDEDMDRFMERLTVQEVSQTEAEDISIVDEYGSPTQSLWEAFEPVKFPGLLYSSVLDDAGDVWLE